jgi:hypothetical protein
MVRCHPRNARAIEAVPELLAACRAMVALDDMAGICREDVLKAVEPDDPIRVKAATVTATGDAIELARLALRSAGCVANSTPWTP